MIEDLQKQLQDAQAKIKAHEVERQNGFSNTLSPINQPNMSQSELGKSIQMDFENTSAQNATGVMSERAQPPAPKTEIELRKEMLQEDTNFKKYITMLKITKNL